MATSVHSPSLGRSLGLAGTAIVALITCGPGCSSRATPPSSASPAPPVRAVPSAGTADATVGSAPGTAATTAVTDSGSTRSRNIVRKKLPHDLSSIALEYTVILIDENGREQPVDPAQHTFRVGDSFLVRIKPQDDVYVYVFNEGPTGDRVCLVPAQDEQPRLVREGEELSLPEGDFLEFGEPAGEEKLLVVAVPQPTDDVRLLARNAFAAQAARLTSQAADGAAEAEAARKALVERSGPQTRGPIRKMIERLDAPVAGDALVSRKERMSHVEPPGEGESSSFGIAISGADAGPPELVLDIPLRSTHSSPTGGR